MQTLGYQVHLDLHGTGVRFSRMLQMYRPILYGKFKLCMVDYGSGHCIGTYMGRWDRSMGSIDVIDRCDRSMLSIDGIDRWDRSM